VTSFATQLLAVTGGDPAGIGLEIVLKSWMRRHELDLPPFFLVADPEQVRGRAAFLGLSIPFIIRDQSMDGRIFDKNLVLEPCYTTHTDCQPGQPSTTHASGIIAAIERAVRLVMQREAGALVTCPIAKKTLYEAGFPFPGHTEFLSHLAEKATGKTFKPVMMLTNDQLRTVPITIHIALAEVAKQLTGDMIIATARIVADDLRVKFGLNKPRLVVAGLNPHAGEGGTMGQEDEMIVRPAVQQLQQMGLDVIGPLPADTLFHETARKKYDVALCMYHDQALIPVKTIGFDSSVNVTLGLPFIRTSPDHGTAFDIAAKAIASPDSLIAAMRLAAQLMENIVSARENPKGRT